MSDQIRIVGIIEAKQTQDGNNIDDVSKTLLDQVEDGGSTSMKPRNCDARERS